MNPPPPDPSFAVLLVDDEEKSLKYFRRIFERQYAVYTAANAEAGYELFRAHRDEIAIVMSDQRMPGQQGVQFLERVRRERPEVIRILSTAYADIDAAVDSVNLGEIYRYVTKPWDLPDLEILLRQAMELFVVRRERNSLLQEKLASMHNLLAADRIMSLGLVGFARKNALRRVGPAMASLLELAVVDETPEGFSLEELRSPAYWRRFHDYHRANLQRVMRQLDRQFENLPGAGKTLAGTVRLSTLVNRLGGAVSGHAAEDGAVWPLDPHLAEALMRPLLKALEPFEGEGGAPRVVLAGEPGDACIAVDLQSPRFQERLPALISPMGESGPSTDMAVELLSAYFALYHHGGSIEIAENNPKLCRLEIRFAPQPQSEDADPSAELIRDLISNELFWSRIFRNW